MLFSMNWPNFIASLALLLKLLVKMCIAIVYYPGCGVMKFEINLIFLIKLFFYVAKSEHKNSNVWRTKRAFKVALQ